MADLVYSEFLVKMKSDILIEQPFTTEELTDEILTAAQGKAFSRLNMYRPRIIRSMSPINLDTHTLIRTYSSRYNTNTQMPFIHELDEAGGDVYLYQVNWDFESVSKDRVAFKYFKDLVVAFSGLFMANKRRTATFNNIPFDLKGDQFFQECQDKIEGIEEKLINTTRNTY